MVFPKSFTSFMLMAFFPPFSFPFFLFFFLNKHFLQIQKQQFMTKRTATMAMAIKAHGGTERKKKCAETINNKAFTYARPLNSLAVQLLTHPFVFSELQAHCHTLLYLCFLCLWCIYLFLLTLPGMSDVISSLQLSLPLQAGFLLIHSFIFSERISGVWPLNLNPGSPTY